MAFEDLLDHRCDIYHMVKGEKDMGFAIKQTGFSYPKVPDVEDVACHFNVNANAELTQTESANEFIYSGKLQLPAGTDVRVNDKVVDKNTGLAYTAEMPHNIRDHHIMVNIQRKGTVKEIYFVGNSISSKYIKDLQDVLKGKDFSINIISKSGTTTEPAIAFRVFKELLIEKYGKEEANKRIYATTDKAKGALKNLANEEGYESFVVPDDVGGRFSVLTAVGLLPIAVSGADIDKLMEGAASGREKALNAPYEENPALLYAAVRNILLRKGKQVEIVANYEPSLHYVSEWWKQLYGESEGKDQKGILPHAVDLTTDLHSMGQFIQDGSRIMFETVLNVEDSPAEVLLKEEAVDTDGMNYLAGKSVDFVNKSAMNGTILAHTDGNVPNLRVNIPEQNAFYLGQLFYFFEFACGISGYLLGVNPFNQPGVESYKKNMFALLGKPGYEDEREKLLKRL